MQVTTSAWYCVRAQNRREHIAAMHVQALLGLNVFCPRICLARQMVNGQSKKFVEPLFPGYFFVETVLESHSSALSSIPGVVDFVRMGEHIPCVPRELIEHIRQTLKQSDLQRVDLPPLQPGDLVRIFEGLFCGMEGEVLSLESGGNRVALLLHLLGRETKVVVRRTACAVAEESAYSYRLPASLKKSSRIAVERI